MAKPIISVSGLRGVVGESLDPAIAIEYACAFASQLSPGPMVVARDGRHSGIMLATAVQSGLNACGRSVAYAQIAATPTVGVLVRDLRAAGGIQISASHNPPPYNGLKLFGPEGRVISATDGQEVMKRFANRAIEWAPYDRLGSCRTLDDTTSRHLELILSTVDVAAIRGRRFRVVLDSNHGAGSLLAVRLFDALGVDAEILGGTPDGQFQHPPEPTAENLRMVASRARTSHPDIIFCQDPDADRLAIIDENGIYVGEEFTLAVVLKHRLSKHPGPVVVNCATSRMSAEIAESLGCPCQLSAVGEANVTDAMLACDAVYGGEGNGGPIDPRVGLVRDSFVAMAQILDALADSKKTISQYIRELPQYAIHKTTIALSPDRISSWLADLEQHNREAKISRLDGLRLDWPDRWLLVRPSNTEPIVRAIAEARHEATAKALCEMAARMVK
jgi:phosphomannomutase